MPRLFLLVPVLLAVAPAAAGAATVDNRNVVSPTGTISCYANVPHEGGGISCSAPGLPRVNEGDPYVALRQRGSSRLGARGDFGGYAGQRRRLRYGDTWKRPGIRCTIRSTGLTCRNLQGHGFFLARNVLRRS